MDKINFDFDAFLTNPVDELPPSYVHDKPGVIGHPPQGTDSDEYLCGSAGPGFPGNNPGRDQDNSRMDERIAAQGCSRYVS